MFSFSSNRVPSTSQAMSAGNIGFVNAIRSGVAPDA
jgi:hypothetical protein